MIRFVYPYINSNEEFIGCGRYFATLSDSPDLKDGYEPAAPNVGHLSQITTVASILAPESFETNKEVYEIKDTVQAYVGDSMGLAYLLALINRSRRTIWDATDKLSDIWCTGTIDIVDNKPFLKNVFQNLFDVKIKAFISDSTDRLFIVPIANLNPIHQQLLKENEIHVLSLSQFRDDSIRNCVEKKTVLKIHAHELTALVDFIFQITDTSEAVPQKTENIRNIPDNTYEYDLFISYVEQEPDENWVWETLMPRLENAGLRVAVSGEVGTPGVARVVNIEQGIRQAKRTVIVLSQAYLADHMAKFENIMAQTMGIQEGTYRLLPIKISPIDENTLPTRLSMLMILNLCHPRRAEREFARLIQALQKPLPQF